MLLLTGCAGVYAEVQASQLSAEFSPSGGGTAMDAGGATSVGFNLGVELGSVRQRFAMGYARQSISLDAASSTLSGSETRYDFNVFNIADRIKLRLGLGAQFGSGTSDFGGMDADDSGGGFFAGLGGTYFLTWKNALHVMAGYQFMTQRVTGGSLAGTGPTFRVTLAHTFGDTRPDKSFVVPLSNATDIIGILERGASSIGCISGGAMHHDTFASVNLLCDGDRRIEYFQIAEGMLVTCRHIQSEGACRRLSSRIVDAAANWGKSPSTPAAQPAATPAPAPAPAPTNTPAPTAPPADAGSASAPAPDASAPPATPAPTP
jgi:hypothetical protein